MMVVAIAMLGPDGIVDALTLLALLLGLTMVVLAGGFVTMVVLVCRRIQNGEVSSVILAVRGIRAIETEES